MKKQSTPELEETQVVVERQAGTQCPMPCSHYLLQELEWDTSVAYLSYHVGGFKIHSLGAGGTSGGRLSRPKAAVHSTSSSKTKSVHSSLK